MSKVVVAAFYKFTDLPDFERRREELTAAARQAGTLGTILIAREGINGTIAGTRKGVDHLLAQIRAFPGCADLDWKESPALETPFHRMKVRLKNEIVTMGVCNIDPTSSHERYIEPEDWNALINDPDIVLIDTRNDYEVAIGAFEGAINPKTKSFREFPEWFRQFRKANPTKKVAMYCTGGIRCEKSTAFLRSEGVEDVFHLKGGILKYLEVIPQAESRWRGECFVFDNRVSVYHDLTPGSYDMCHACRMPISEADKASSDYLEGVSCPHCAGKHTQAQLRAFRERQKQVELAEARGQAHIGVKAE